MSGAEVVVTGIGMVTPLGATAAATAEAWRAGRGAERRTLEELRGTSLEGAEVAAPPAFDAAQRLGERRMLKYMSDAAVIGCVAAREATAGAELKRRFRPERVGLYAGTGLAAANVKDALPMIRESIDESGAFSCARFGKQGLAVANPLLSFKILANMPACLVSLLETIKGPNLIFTPWEGQTAAALVEGWSAVAAGEVDCAVAGGADWAAHAASLVFLKQSGLLGDGEYPSAAAAYLVFERAETARRDGRRIHAMITHMDVVASGGEVRDPLSQRMGRSFAAAPAVLLALACLTGDTEIAMCGVDQQEFRARVGQVVNLSQTCVR